MKKGSSNKKAYKLGFDPFADEKKRHEQLLKEGYKPDFESIKFMQGDRECQMPLLISLMDKLRTGKTIKDWLDGFNYEELLEYAELELFSGKGKEDLEKSDMHQDLLACSMYLYNIDSGLEIGDPFEAELTDLMHMQEYVQFVIRAVVIDKFSDMITIKKKDGTIEKIQPCVFLPDSFKFSDIKFSSAAKEAIDKTYGKMKGDR